MDTLGRIVRTMPLALAQTSATLQLDNLAKGPYLLRLIVTEYPSSQKIMLE
jgi:hypothetical protein